MDEPSEGVGETPIKESPPRRGFRQLLRDAANAIGRFICIFLRCKIDDRSSACSEESEINKADATEECKQIVTLNTQTTAACLEREYHAELANMTLRGVITGRFLTLHRRCRRRHVTRSLVKDMALLDDLLLGQVQFILNRSVTWRFNAFTLDNVSGGRCLPVLCVHLFHMYGLIKHFNLEAERVWKLFSLIEDGYHSSNPYHNSVHAVDVTQAMHCFLQQDRIREHMQPLEVLASLLAAIAHDLDHPGVSQPFLVTTSNHLARLYHNSSVLENHHWRSAVSCMLESRVLAHVLVDETQRALVSQISSLILATDISRQQEYLNRFRIHLDEGTLDLSIQEHRHLVLQMALKCADISNPCRPWEISRKWSLKVCEEFFRQGDYERKLNLPITALCDRYTTSIPKIQTGFFKFVVSPLMNQWHRFLHNNLTRQMMRNLLYNQNKWETLMEEELEEEAKNKLPAIEIVEETDEEEDEVGSMSDSAEKLLPLRRRSRVKKRSTLKRDIRRHSVPLSLFNNSSFKGKEEAPQVEETSFVKTKPNQADASFLSQLKTLKVQCEASCSSDAERVLSCEKLLLDTSIASITTSPQASRFHTVKECSALKLVRQQTYSLNEIGSVPPLGRENRFCIKPQTLSRAIDEALDAEAQREPTGVKSTDICVSADEDDEEAKDRVDIWSVSGRTGRRRSAPTESRFWEESEGGRAAGRRGGEEGACGSQLRNNLGAVRLAAEPLLRRRKSMPPDVVAAPMLSDLSSVLPEMLRTLSTKDTLSRRRGSAPVPLVGTCGPLVGTCGPLAATARRMQVGSYQWLPTTYNQALPLHRRSSLPAEVFHLTEDFTDEVGEMDLQTLD